MSKDPALSQWIVKGGRDAGKQCRRGAAMNGEGGGGSRRTVRREEGGANLAPAIEAYALTLESTPYTDIIFPRKIYDTPPCSLTTTVYVLLLSKI